MSTKENLMPLSEKRENQKTLLDVHRVTNSKETGKNVKTALFSKPGLKETKANHTKLQVGEEEGAKPLNTTAHKLEKEQQDVLVYIPENPRRSPSPQSVESLLEYPETKINIHHRKEADFLRFEPPNTNKTKLKELEKKLEEAVKHKDELASRVQDARKQLKSKNHEAQKIDHKIQQMTKYKASIEFNKQEMVENQAIYEELIGLLETANDKGVRFGQVLERYDDEVNRLLDTLSLTNYRIQEFKESHTPCTKREE